MFVKFSCNEKDWCYLKDPNLLEIPADPNGVNHDIHNPAWSRFRLYADWGFEINEQKIEQLDHWAELIHRSCDVWFGTGELQDDIKLFYCNSIYPENADGNWKQLRTIDDVYRMTDLFNINQKVLTTRRNI